MKPPEPVVTARVCSVCGLTWDEAHESKPSQQTCIEALKVALERARNPPLQGWGAGATVQQPFIQPMNTGTPLPPMNPNICGSS